MMEIQYPIYTRLDSGTMFPALAEMRDAVNAVYYAADGGQQDGDLDDAVYGLVDAFNALKAAMVADGLLRITMEGD